jgi:hypothetical protein
MRKTRLFATLIFQFIAGWLYAQKYNSPDQLNQLRPFQDSLKRLGLQMINNESDVERKNANYQFIRTLVRALRVPNSYAFNFDSVKTISNLRSPDNKFRIMSWFVQNEDGSYRFYGAIQMNTGGKLSLFPLEDYSPLLKNPADSVTDSRKWYGAEYYKIIQVNAATPYYVLLGWKGNTVKSTKKVIEAIWFKDGRPTFGLPVFNAGNTTLKRMIFEYNRQTSMLLRYVPEQNLIVFDHLSPPDNKMKGQLNTYGPDLTYDGFKLINGKWVLKENLDMRNIPAPSDADLPDPKQQAIKDRNLVPRRKTN